jgi:hypothetical protein
MTEGRSIPVQSAALALSVLAGACAEQAPEPSAQRTEPTAGPTLTGTPLPTRSRWPFPTDLTTCQGARVADHWTAI